MRLPGINGSISNWTVCPSPQKFKQLRPGDLVRMDYFTRREFTSIMPQVQIRGHVLWCVDEELAIAWLTHTEKDTKYEPPPVVVIAWKDVRTVLEVIYACLP